MKKIGVLIVEDSFYSADLNIREIKKAGFNVQHQIVASRKAMEKALRDKQWDVILSDHHMPGFDAFQALEVRNQEGCTVPFVIVSEDMLDQDIRTAIKKGCQAYISKECLAGLGQQIKEILKIPND
ncbi:MAG: response regulator [Clostridia bacterium]|jgi:CheY-like chemotaxis protein|nr:response regulator [Clostridia bacterium]